MARIPENRCGGRLLRLDEITAIFHAELSFCSFPSSLSSRLKHDRASSVAAEGQLCARLRHNIIPS